MKLLMIIGGLMGFSIGVGLSLIHGNSWPSVILRASIATCIAGFLMRWWGQVWMKSLKQALIERARAAKPKPKSMPATAKP